MAGAAHARIATARLRRLASSFPAVSILGARQAGKSTLARLAFPRHAVFDLEDPTSFDRVRADPLLVLTEHPRLILDEAQRLPELFPIVRSFLDRNERSRIVLLGSASPALVRGISESLTGRVGLFELDGISVFEEPPAAIWLRGGFPRVHWSRPRARPEDWYPSYLRTTLEQDLPQLGITLSSVRLRTLLTMVAHAQGSLLNLSEIGGSLSVSYHTVSHLLDVLEGVFLVRRLRPYAANLRKRLVKAPKVYVRDTGLLHSLLGIPFRRPALLAHPKAGASFETFCIEQILSHARLSDSAAEGYFFRTHGGTEIDLLLSTRGRLVPIEIKLGLGMPDLRSLEAGMRELGLATGYVVNAGRGSTQIRRGIRLCGLTDLLRELGVARR